MKNPLKQYAHNKSSQFGENGIIEKIFQILPKQEEYWCVEFGAWDGKHLSNTYELITNKGWKGVLIEGSATKFPDLIKNYEGNNNAILIHKLVSFEGENTLDNIFKQTDIPINFDLISIDIDGNDYYVWESLENYNPKVVIIEFNPSIPSDVEFVQEKNFLVNQGNSLLSLIKLGKQKGYELIATTECNGVFVKKEYYATFKIEDNNISTMWDTEVQAPRVFQLYDGTLVLSEKFKLLWQHNQYVDIFDLQKQPKFLRTFKDSANVKEGLFTKILKYTYYKLQAIKQKLK